MGLDVWFRQDVARVLASTQETLASSFSAVPPLDQELSGAYRQGFSDALKAIAVAFGLSDAPGTARGQIADTVPGWPIPGQDRFGESWH